MKKKQHELDAVLEVDREYVRLFSAGSSTGISAPSIDQLDKGLLTGKNIAIVLSRRLTFMRTLPLPDASEADLKLIVRGKLVDIFPLPAHELSSDFTKTQVMTDEGKLCAIYAARTTDIQSLMNGATTHGFRIQQVVPVNAIKPSVVGLEDSIVVDSVGAGYGIDVYSLGSHIQSRFVPSLEAAKAEIERLGQTGPHKVYTNDPAIEGVRLEGPVASLLAESSSVIDLEPEEFKKKKEDLARSTRHRQGYFVFAAAFCVCALAIKDRAGAQDVVNRKIAKDKVSTEKLKKIQSAYEAKLTALNPESKQLNQAFKPAQRVGDIAYVVSQLVPPGVWLTGITIERGKPLTIRGTAKQAIEVAQFVKSLGEQKRFRDVKLLFASNGEIESNKVVQFSISAFPIGNLPILEQGSRKK